MGLVVIVRPSQGFLGTGEIAFISWEQRNNTEEQGTQENKFSIYFRRTCIPLIPCEGLDR